MTHRVVVTGLGLVTPVGNDVESTWTRAARRQAPAPRRSRSSIRQQLSGALRLRGEGVRPAAVHGPQGSAALRPLRPVRARGRAPGGDPGGAGRASSRRPSAPASIIGSGIGGMQTFEEQLLVYLTKGPDRVSPFFVPMFIPDIAAGLVSIRYGLKGPNFATVSACASSAHAIGESFQLIQHGDADAMVDRRLRGGDHRPRRRRRSQNMKALSTRNDSPETASRPFDQDRDGFVLGDGGGDGGAREPGARRARGAPRSSARCSGYGAERRRLPHHRAGAETARAPSGPCALPRGRRHRRRATSATSTPTAPRTPQGDIAETEAVKAVFGEHARQAGVRLDQVDDRAPARRRRRARVRRSRSWRSHRR